MSNSPQSPNHSPELEPQLEAAVWAVLSESLDADAIDRVKARALNVCLDSHSNPVVQGGSSTSSQATTLSFGGEQSSPTRSPVPLSSMSFLMKLLSMAAGIVLVVGTVVVLQSSPSAFGAAIRQLRMAKSLTYVTQVYVEGNPKPIETKEMIAEDGRRRSEINGDLISITDASGQTRLRLLAGSTRALVMPQGKDPVPEIRHNQKTWLENLRALGDKPVERLGQKVLNGRSVEGFVARQGQFAYTVWVDTKTKELVEIEHKMFVKGSSIKRVVMTDFRMNEALDESLFSLEVPAGYEVQKQAELPKVPGGEKSIIEALRGFTQRSGGAFPKSITEWGEWAVLFSTVGPDGKPREDATEIMAHLGSIMPFLITRSQDDYQYLGAGKSLKDQRCIVFWYRTDELKLRAIYNDLTIADVQKKDLP